MKRLVVWMALLLLALTGCKDKSTGDGSGQGEGEAASPEAEAQAEQETQEAAQPAEPDELFEGIRDGMFVSERFNVQFTCPLGWEPVTTTADDSIQINGPDGIQMIVANSQSIQLLDTNFSQLNDRVSFDRVNILPDRSDASPLNGLPGYRVEGDALLQGEDVSVYFMSQALSVPGEPIMATIFVPGDYYYEHSNLMKGVLDSLEAVDLTPR